MKIEFLYFDGCPNVESTRLLLERCLARLGTSVAITEREGDFSSPTVLVNGLDVMGMTLVHGRGCRRDLPTEERILNALTEAVRNEG